ncbi:MAG: DUF4388 domain-containing protein [Planctomycetota bacterium]
MADAQSSPTTGELLDSAVVSEVDDGLEREVEQLREGNQKLRLELEAMRGDLEGQLEDQAGEVRVQREAQELNAGEIDELQNQLDSAKQAAKFLKEQNLELQHQLNCWGIPVSRGTDSSVDAMATHRFFAPIVPNDPGVDPAPVVLRGDLSAFHLTALLSFLEHCNLLGVLTIVNGDLLTKLFIEGPALRLVAWNRRDEELSLGNLLIESELLADEEVAPFREENLYDLEVATRLLYEGKLDAETIRVCLREHTRVIITQLFQVREGSFFFQPGKPSCHADLLFNLSTTDLLLRTATHLDEETREVGDDDDLGDLLDIDDLDEGF